MSRLEVIQIVASCVRAFNNSSEFVARLQAKDTAGEDVGARSSSQKELWLQEVLQESLTEGGLAVSNHFKAEQKALGTHGHLLQKGDDIAKQELLSIVVTLQNEILDKLGHDRETDHARSAADDLKALQKTAIFQQQEAMRSITELRKRLVAHLPQASASSHVPGRRHTAETMADSFVADAVDFSKGTGKQRQPRASINSLTTIRPETLVPEIRADDIDALTIAESNYEDDRFTIAPEAPYPSVPVALPLSSLSTSSSSRHAPQPRHFKRFSFSSAASMRAAEAPEPVQHLAALESVGPYFPPRFATGAHPERSPPTWSRPRDDRPSISESQILRPDGMPLASRVFSNASVASSSPSPRISEPDSVVSSKKHSTKPYCDGAVVAQGNFVAGFLRNLLPILPGSDKRELCWKCKECDFNASDGDGQLLERIEFRYGTRFRFMFLARCHVPYRHPEDALKPRYQYGCRFCTAEGKQSLSWPSVDKLMSHIRDKHQTNLTPEVKARTNCVVGRVAERDEEWDCNFPDVTKKASGFRNFMIHAVTSLPT